MSSTNESGGYGDEFREDSRRLGYVTIVCCPILILLQIRYLKQIFQRRWTFEAEFSMPLLFIIGVFDIFQLIAHTSAGIKMVIWDSEFPGLFIFGALVTCGWNSAIWTLCFLSVHRFFWVAFPKKAHYVVSHHVSKMFLIALTVYILFHFFISLTRVSDVTFRPDIDFVSWHVEGNVTTNINKQLIFMLNSISNYAVVYFNLPFYLGLGAMLFMRLKQYRSASDNFILIQMFSFWIYGVVTWAIWEFYYTDSENYYFRYVYGVVLWVIWNGMKPVAALIQTGVRRLFANSDPRRRNVSVAVKSISGTERTERTARRITMSSIVVKTKS